MSNVIDLHAERWVEGVFELEGFRVDVSSIGNVRFWMGLDGEIPSGAIECRILSMKQMAQLGEALSIAYSKDSDDNG
jgi:hypothetical protein